MSDDEKKVRKVKDFAKDKEKVNNVSSVVNAGRNLLSDAASSSNTKSNVDNEDQDGNYKSGKYDSGITNASGRGIYETGKNIGNAIKNKKRVSGNFGRVHDNESQSSFSGDDDSNANSNLRFELPHNERKSLLDRLLDFKKKANKEKTEGILKGVFKGKAKNTVSKSAIQKGIFKVLKGLLGKLFLFGLLFIFIVSVIYAFINMFIRENNDNDEARRLDMRLGNIIFYVKQREEISKEYEALINAAPEYEKIKYKNNYDKFVNSDKAVKTRAGETPEEGFPMMNSENWVLLNLDRITYAWGGYLEWQPEYLLLGANIISGGTRNANVENVEKWRPLCEEIGAKYCIDPAILMTIIDIESSGNPHAQNSKYKGLCAIGENFQAYFRQEEKWKRWSLSKRVPTDKGTCDYSDEEHQEVARFQIEYAARHLTGQMTYFVQQKYGKNYKISDLSQSEIQEAIYFTIGAYNQGEGTQMALYNRYPDLYKDEGRYYTEVFQRHERKTGTAISGSSHTIGLGNSTYLELAFKFYKEYSKGKADLSSAASNYDYSTLDKKWCDLHWGYKNTALNSNQNGNDKGNSNGSNDDESKKIEYENLSISELDSDLENGIIRLSSDSKEKELIEGIQEKYLKEELIYNVNQYNSWMKKLNEYYKSKYPEKFLKDEDGKLIPDIYAKDAYGFDTSTVIKNKSYIHNIVDTITKYDTTKKFEGSFDEAYAALNDYLINGKVEGEKTEIKQVREDITRYEKNLSLNRYGQFFEILSNTDTPNEIFSNGDAKDNIMSSISYQIPGYTYVTMDKNEAKKSFFDYEIYEKKYYHSSNDYLNNTLKIDKKKFNSIVDKLNTIGLSAGYYLKGKGTPSEQRDLENRINKIFDVLYLRDDKLIDSRNHELIVPANASHYFMTSNGQTYDRMIEKVSASEVYESDYTVPNTPYEIKWTFVDSVPVSLSYKGLEANIIREYVMPNIKPDRYTSIRGNINFSYTRSESGDRNVKNKEANVTYERGDIYVDDEIVGTTYRKKITRASIYVEEKIMHMTTEKE